MLIDSNIDNQQANLIPSIQILFFKMVKGTFILSAHIPKTEHQKQRVQTRTTNLRYAVVVLAIAVVFVYEYCYDNPSALEENIETNYYRKNQEQLSGSQFNLLYSVYSFPNVLIPLIGGTLIDRVGARIVFIITCGFCVIGQLICSFGGMSSLFWLMLVGRAVYGVGGEVLQGAQSIIISNWFRPEQLSLVLGICLSFPKMGSALNNYLTPVIANHYASQDPENYEDVGMPLFASFIAMSFGLICTFILAYIDKSTQKQADEEFGHMIVPDLKRIKTTPKLSPIHKIPKLPYYTPQPTARTLPLIRQEREKNEIKEEDESEEEGVTQQQKQPQKIVEEPQTGGQHINFKEILKLPGSYWLLIVVATICETLFIPFLDNGNKYYTAVFIGIESPEQAGIYLVVPYVLAAALVPILGIWVEKVEKRSYLIILNLFFFALAYLTMMYTETNPAWREAELVRWLPVTFLGIGTGMFCSIVVPTLPMLVDPKLLGTAFGLMEMMQNLALGVFPLITGAIRERVSDNNLQGFHQQSLFFFIVASLGLGLSLILKGVDLVTGSLIDRKGFRQKFIENVLQPVKVVEY